MRIWKVLSVTALLGILHFEVGADFPDAGEIIASTGIESGLCVVLGSTDGQIESALTVDGRMLVQGLALTDDQCRTAREYIFQQGTYGLASVEKRDNLVKLPYYDRLVNLLVADLDELGTKGPSEDEILRVLGYNGCAYLKKSGIWRKVEKGIPSEVDEFTHWFRDASRSNYSTDQLVGPPNALRSVGQPVEPNGYYALRVGGGVAIMKAGRGDAMKFDDGGDPKLPPRIFAKDAFSGVLLWTKENVSYDGEWAVIGDNRVYVYSDERGAPLRLTGLNLYTGVEETGIEVAQRNDDDCDSIRKFGGRGNSFAVESGKLLHCFGTHLWARNESDLSIDWQKNPPDGGYFRTFVVSEGVVIALVQKHPCLTSTVEFYRAGVSTQEFVALIAYSFDDGEELWRYDGEELYSGVDYSAPSGVYVYDLSGCANGLLPVAMWDISEEKKFQNMMLTLIDVKNGQRKWSTVDQVHYVIGKHPYRDFYQKDGRLYMSQLNSAWVYDLNDGSRLHDAGWGGNRTGSGGVDYYNNCNNSVATPNYMVLMKYFVSWRDALSFTKSNGKQPPYYLCRLVSHQCIGHHTPAYGSLYSDQGTCNCNGFLPGSMALFTKAPTVPVDDANRLMDAYPGTLGSISISTQNEARQGPVAVDWKLPEGRSGMCYTGPTGDRRRAGGSYPLWRGYGKTSTTPISVGDLTVTAYTNEHRLTAARSGSVVWHFIAGGRIGAPPVTDGSTICFSSYDGYVYGVNASDGSLRWKFLAAPEDLRMVAFGQVESAWPVFNVVAQDGNVYFAAGRHQDLDQGIHFYGLKMSDGEQLWHVKYASGLATERGSNDGVGGEVGIVDGKLVLNPPLSELVQIDLQNPTSTIMFEENLMPPLDPGVSALLDRPRSRRNHAIPSAESRSDESAQVVLYDMQGRKLKVLDRSTVGKYISKLKPGYYIAKSGAGARSVLILNEH